MTIKAVIFDLDGVLVDSKNWHYTALNKALSMSSYDKIQKHEHLSRFDGLPTREKLMMLLEDGRINEFDISAIELHKRHAFDSIIRRNDLFNKLIENTIDILYFLGYRIGVASNAIESTVIHVLKEMRISAMIHSVLSNEDVDRKKPDPEIYIKSMNILRVRPEETLILEDNANGIASAKASGANVLIVNSSKDVNRKNIFEKIEQLNKECVLNKNETLETHQKSAQKNKEA